LGGKIIVIIDGDYLKMS